MAGPAGSFDEELARIEAEIDGGAPPPIDRVEIAVVEIRGG